MTETMRAHRVLTTSALTVLALSLGACSPRQTGLNQCPPININLTELKDATVAPNDDPELLDEIDGLVADFLTQTHAPGCAVGVMKDDQVYYLQTYGHSDMRDPFDPTDDVDWTLGTTSALASISKTLTALAIFRLQERGLLDIDDTPAEHLDGIYVGAPWGDITIRELLSHTSGLQREPSFFENMDTEAELSAFYDDLVPHPGMHPRLTAAGWFLTPIVGFEPDRTARYSNAGYVLLGAVIDSIVHQNPGLFPGQDSYEDNVWRTVGFYDGNAMDWDQMLTPCLFEYWRKEDDDRLARGYEFTLGEYNERGITAGGPAGWEGPAGGWFMTIGDLTRFMVALNTNAIIDQDSREEMMVVHGVDGERAWGLGVQLDNIHDRDAFLHDGKYDGYRSRYVVWPEDGVGVAVLVNEDDADPTLLANAIGLRVLDVPVGGIPLPGGAPGQPDPAPSGDAPSPAIPYSALRGLVPPMEAVLRSDAPAGTEVEWSPADVRELLSAYCAGCGGASDLEPSGLLATLRADDRLPAEEDELTHDQLTSVLTELLGPDLDVDGTALEVMIAETLGLDPASGETRSLSRVFQYTQRVCEIDPDDDGCGSHDFEELIVGEEVKEQLGCVRVSGTKPVVAFDTGNICCGDADLATPGTGAGNDTSLGNVLIIQEDDSDCRPDDARDGGTMWLTWDSPVNIHAIGLLDIDEEGGMVRGRNHRDHILLAQAIPAMGDNSHQVLDLSLTGVTTLEIELQGSGALTEVVVTPSRARLLLDR
ncbi:MAG: serine hydrolase domain-containing protein, partial [Acidobacteriota bacterium]